MKKFIHLVILALLLAGCGKTVDQAADDKALSTIETETPASQTAGNPGAEEAAESSAVPEIPNKSVLNDSGVRVRDYPNLESSTLTHLDRGKVVSVLKKTEEELQIGEMLAPWYQISFNNEKSGAEMKGWIYGYFLDFEFDLTGLPEVSLAASASMNDRTIDPYCLERLQFSLNYNIQKIDLDSQPSPPTFENEDEQKAYNLIAGIYSLAGPRSPGNETSLFPTRYSWGLEYRFGRGIYTLDTDGEKWTIGGDGEARHFTIESVDSSGVTIRWTSNTTPPTSKIEILEDHIKLDRSTYYPLSTPINYLSFLKKVKEKREASISRYNVIPPDESSLLVGGKVMAIHYLLKENDPEGLINYISDIEGLDIRFNPGVWLSPDKISMDNEEYSSSIATVSSDLNSRYAPDYMESVFFFNEYIVSDLESIQKEYPGSITVEFYHDNSTFLVFVFMKDEMEWKLVRVVNHTLDFA